MSPPTRPFAPHRHAALGLALVLAMLAIAAGAFAPRLAASRLRAAAAERGLRARWDALELDASPGARVRGLRLYSAAGDTALSVDSLRATLDPFALLLLRVRIASVEMAHVRAHAPAHAAADPDTLAPDAPIAERDRSAGAEKVRAAAARLVRTLLLPARRLPRLALRDVRIAGRDDDGALTLRWLQLERADHAVILRGEGVLETEQRIPFDLSLRYADDDRLAGGASFAIPDAEGNGAAPLRVAIDGGIVQDRAHGRVHLADSSLVTLGSLRLRLAGSLDRRGPSVAFTLAADDVDAARLRQSIPRPLLGPLVDLAVRGTFDYRLSFALDLAAPDSVRFDADVIPHDLAIDRATTRLDLEALAAPFTARVHLPKDRILLRDLSAANPHYRPLESIDSLLAYALITNEDGGFFRHHGFNTESVRGAIADNIRAGRFKRGAGTITMQLVRNLYLGHARTLSRKGQEVVLAWTIEHLAHLSKRRLLEIYLNIIEWGPETLGADEATHYYFGHDAGRVSIDEALFLATVVPAPTKWRYRFDATGDLRPFERAQMHFIGRAMVAKGWLDPAQLPEADRLHVELRGPARDVLFPPSAPEADTTKADAIPS